MYDRDEVDELMDDLTRPFYVLRMARAKLAYPYSGVALVAPQVTAMRKSAKSSAKKAKAEIREILVKHMED